MYPPIRAHWIHLANTIELVLPSAHLSRRQKRQIDRFSRFRTAHSRVSSGTLASSGEYDVLLSAEPSPQPKRQINRFSRSCTAHGRKFLFFTVGDPLPPNCPFLWGSRPNLIHDSLGPSEPKTKTASRSVQPFLQGSLVSVWQTDPQTDQQSDRSRYSVCNKRPHQRT